MIGNPVWGSLLDRIGLRTGMMAAVALWSAASASHAAMTGFFGFAAARALLGFGEGATFPGGLRTAMDSLPPVRQARGLALSYSGGSLGAILTPLLVVPLSLRYGWRAVFLMTGIAGLAWIAMWLALARPPLLPVSRHTAARFHWPNPFERRFWALVCSYALGAIALGPILYLSPLYLQRVHHLTQAELGRVLWVPPLGWEVGYFLWGWVADRRAERMQKPFRLFLLLALSSLPLGLVPLAPSVPLVLLLFFWATLTASGFIVISLRAAALSYPASHTAMVAGIAAGSWSALVAVLLPGLGRLFDSGHYAETFYLVAGIPMVGVLLWRLSSRQDVPPSPVS
jgi:ACS family hexuronate transporter-like MFS transporter